MKSDCGTNQTFAITLELNNEHITLHYSVNFSSNFTHST